MGRPQSAEVSSRGTTRVDGATGVEEIEDFFGPDGDAIAACTHLPKGEAEIGLVICPSLFNEFIKNYRRDVLLARGLAAHGVAVQRFHWRGTGHSDGDHTTITFDTMREDVACAATQLRAMSGVTKLAYLGTRFGALPAANVAVADGAPLAVFEPVLDAGGFFREGFRAKMMANLKTKDPQQLTREQLLEELTVTGSLDVLGDPVGRALYESTAGRSLAGELGDQPRPMLLVQLGADLELRSEFSRAVTALEALGFDVRVEKVGSREVWWFFDEREFMGENNNRPLGMGTFEELAPMVADWLAHAVNQEVAR